MFGGPLTIVQTSTSRRALRFNTTTSTMGGSTRITRKTIMSTSSAQSRLRQGIDPSRSQTVETCPGKLVWKESFNCVSVALMLMCVILYIHEYGTRIPTRLAFFGRTSAAKQWINVSICLYGFEGQWPIGLSNQRRSLPYSPDNERVFAFFFLPGIQA